MSETVHIIGAGLAGCEAAFQLARRNRKVTLFEMRPLVMTPAHKTGMPAEMVCSNSLKSDRTDTGAGLLKAELQILGSELLQIAEHHRVPAGGALAVDRAAFANAVAERLDRHPNIERVIEHVTSLDSQRQTILATGPLTSEALTSEIIHRTGEHHLYFFDAIAPVVDNDTIDRRIAYSAARYDKGDADYLNCPFDKEQYLRFVQALREAEKFEAHEFENRFFQNPEFRFYENCVPIEELARRDVDTLRFGVMRPVGLHHPATGKRPWAVLQLRMENKNGTAWNLVGCQTMLRQKEQRQVFRLIPGLQSAQFLRFGSIHRNTFLDTPVLCDDRLRFHRIPSVTIAGQLSGLEGYVESIAGGIMAARSVLGESLEFPETTIMGGLYRHLRNRKENFQPMNASFGLLPPLETTIRDKKKKRLHLSDRSMQAMKDFTGL